MSEVLRRCANCGGGGGTGCAADCGETGEIWGGGGTPFGA